MIQRIGALRSPALAVPLPPSLELEACYRYCEALCRARHHNYPVASFFTRSKLRKHIWAMFAFARVADDFADEPAYEGRRSRELDRWEEQLFAAYRGRDRVEHPVFVALADTVKKFSLPITEFRALLSGFRTDLDVRRFATWGELHSYTAQSAEPVGHLLLYIGGYRSPPLHAFANDLSTGLAFARLLQDVPADWTRGRIYIPGEDLVHFDVSEADIASRSDSAAVGALVRYEVARTRALFERARPLVDAVGADLAVELALMWHGGMRILDKMADAGRTLFTKPPRLTAGDKAIALSRALAWRGDTLPPRAIELLRRSLGASRTP
jgi:hydroxysqualene synthase